MATPSLQVFVDGQHLPLVDGVSLYTRRVPLWDASARYTCRVVLDFADTPDGQPPQGRYWAERVEVDQEAWTFQITGAIAEPPPVFYVPPG